MRLKNYSKNIKTLCIALLICCSSFTVFSQTIYTNDMEYVLGDVKQVFITNKVLTEAYADNLLKAFTEMKVNGIRIPLFGRDTNGVDLNPNKPMFDYFYTQALAQGFLIFANPAHLAGVLYLLQHIHHDLGHSGRPRCKRLYLLHPLI